MLGKMTSTNVKTPHPTVSSSTTEVASQLTGCMELLDQALERSRPLRHPKVSSSFQL